MVNLVTHTSENLVVDSSSTESIPLNLGYSKVSGLGKLSCIEPKGKFPKRMDVLRKLKRLIVQGDRSFDNADYLEAEKSYRAALSQAELLGEAELIASCCNLIGGCLGNQGRHREALAYFGRVVELCPEFPAAWWNQAIALQNLGKSEEALLCLDRILALGVKDANAWHVKGTILYNLRQYEDALGSFIKALDLVPDSGIAWLNRGLTLLRLQRFEEAATAFEQAYGFPKTIGNDKTALYAAWSYALILNALQAELSRDPESVEYWADYWGDVKERAKEDRLDSVMEDIIAKLRVDANLPERNKRAFLKVERKLRRMENPLYRLKALRDSISRKWPEGISAVEAIREDRD
ncbi:MAG: tetratricopeptide repeat protein [Chloroflexi bacterium]|nr:tetratricopeptide repeat protein [Chloroflexota bacterium]